MKVWAWGQKEERWNEPKVGTLMPWGKAGLSNREDRGEGSEERPSYSPLRYHRVRAAMVRGEAEDMLQMFPLCPHRRASKSTEAKSCSTMTEAF